MSPCSSISRAAAAASDRLITVARQPSMSPSSCRDQFSHSLGRQRKPFINTRLAESAEIEAMAPGGIPALAYDGDKVHRASHVVPPARHCQASASARRGHAHPRSRAGTRPFTCARARAPTQSPYASASPPDAPAAPRPPACRRRCRLPAPCRSPSRPRR